MTKEAFYLSQKFFEDIKAWGTLDYEEYFNRKIVWSVVGSWYYSTPTGFWNFWSWGVVGTTTYGDVFYFCRSWVASSMGNQGCFNNNFNTYGSALWTKPQRYGQYAFQFIDFNINQDADLGDEDGNADLRGDADDEHLWEGPIVFTWGTNVRELYLISGDGKKRTLFRWNLKNDPKKPASATCDFTAGTGSGCLGTIEVLKLSGKDLWSGHNGLWATAYDGMVDTWVIDETFAPGTPVVAGSTTTNYWQPLFGDNIHVKDFKVFAYPNINIEQAWKSTSLDANMNPYVRIDMTLMPSWKKRSGMKWNIPEIKISTTINLVEYFSK